MTTAASWKLLLALSLSVAATGVGVYAALAATWHPETAASGRARHVRLSITGNARRSLTPGVSAPLNLRLANRYGFGLWITRLTVRLTVDPRHAAAGCTGAANFTIRQLGRAAFPIRLPRRRARTLRALGLRRLPQVGMRDLPATDQGACKGASLTLRYSAMARRDRPRFAIGRRVRNPSSP